MKTFILLIAILFASPSFAYDSYYRSNSAQEMIDRRDAQQHRKIMQQEAQRTNDMLLNQQLQQRYNYGAGKYRGGSSYNYDSHGSDYRGGYDY